MSTESDSLSLLSIISLASFFTFFVVSKFSNKIGNGVLLDRDFEKPQAFHKELVPRSGGLAGMVSLTIFFILYYFYIFLLFYFYDLPGSVDSVLAFLLNSVALGQTL